MSNAERGGAKIQRVVKNKVVEAHELGDRTVIGRSKTADLLLVDPSVSREHGVIVREGERWILEDLGSANGLQVNGEQNKRHALAEGDIITMGDSVLIFTWGLVAVEPDARVNIDAHSSPDSDEPWTGEADLLFQVPASDPLVDLLGDRLKGLLVASCLNENDRHYLLWALNEALSNALRHGAKRDPLKIIECRLIRTDQRVVARVSDAGPGFDFQERLAIAKTGDAIGVARTRFEEGGVGGLGIMLMIKCVDLVEFNESGNTVTLTKCPGNIFQTQTIYAGLGFEAEEPPELPDGIPPPPSASDE
jgi:anti-sigma regulatory factor (Ser/Thr protein kinase)